MVKKVLILIAVIFTTQLFSQVKAIRFFEYAKSADTNLVIIDIKTPSSVPELKDTVTNVEIDMKGAQFLMINYLKRKSRTKDTCYIATYNEADWKGIDPKDSENPCEIDKYDCNCLILDDRIYMIRYRIGTRTRSYRLILKNYSHTE